MTSRTPKISILARPIYMRYFNKIGPLCCRDCGIPLTINDKYVRRFTGASKGGIALYCVKCAREMCIL